MSEQALPPTSAELRAIRAKLGLTQEAMKARYGCSMRTYTRWESGETVPTERTLMLARSWLAVAGGHKKKR
jgi:transcriptional regulator with XRE-family HTH domain